MAVRKRLLHDDATREKIRVSQLINRLQDNAMGQVELTQTQQRSIEILLKKSLPDLSAVDHTTKGEALTGVRWLSDPDELQSSHTTQESNSSHTTNGKTAGLS